jgi:hypothetical protein
LLTEDTGYSGDKAMQMTAYARLEQFRTDIEKLLAEKALQEPSDHHAEESETPAPNDQPGSSIEDATSDVAAKNFFQAVDDALAVLN